MKDKPRDRKEYLKTYYSVRKSKYIDYRMKNKNHKKKYDIALYKRNKEKISEFSRTPEGRYKTYKASAKKRGFLFDISQDEFISFIGKSCFYCGEIALGIDRIDSSLGYINGNIVSCCKDCNWMKSNKSTEEFIM